MCRPPRRAMDGFLVYVILVLPVCGPCVSSRYLLCDTIDAIYGNTKIHFLISSMWMPRTHTLPIFRTNSSWRLFKSLCSFFGILWCSFRTFTLLNTLDGHQHRYLGSKSCDPVSQENCRSVTLSYQLPGLNIIRHRSTCTYILCRLSI